MIFHYLGFLSVVFSLLSIIIFGQITPNYSHAKDYTSYLGMRDRKYHRVMNLLGFIVPGLLLMLYGIYLLGKTQIVGNLGSVLLSLSGLFWLLIGFFPYEPQDSRKIHERTVDLANLFGVISVFLFSINFLYQGPVWFGVISLFIILLLVVRLLTKFETKVVKKGLFQKMVIFTFFSWVVCLNFVFL